MNKLLTYKIAGVSTLALTPFILRLYHGYWATSISAYAERGLLFTGLLSLAASFFLLDAVQNKKRWYNYTFAIALFITGVTNHIIDPIPHFGAAGWFYIMQGVSILVYTSKEQLWFKIPLSACIYIPLGIHYAFGVFSLLLAESLANLPILVHYIGEAKGKFD